MDPIITIENLMNRQYPEQAWVVDGLIPAAAITILSAPPASYKTWTLLQTALSVARGEPLFGQFTTNQTGILIIEEEDDARLIQKRLFQLGATADLPIYFTPGRGFKANKETVDNVLLSCKTYGVGLLVIDSLVRIHKADENSAGDMAQVFEQLRRFADNDIAVLITHHNRKPGTTFNGASYEMRGSSDILASVDCHISVGRKHTNLTFNQTKQRYAQELEPFTVQVVADDNSFAFEYTGAASTKDDKAKIITNAVMKLLGEHERLFQKELLQQLDELGIKTNEHKLRELLKDWVEAGSVVETTGSGNTKYYSLNSEANDE